MSNESARQKVLRTYAILDTPREQSYDDLTRLAAHVCGTPMAAIVLIDATRQWCKAEIGMPPRAADLTAVFGAYAIESDELLLVEDAIQDPRFATHPSVVGEPQIRFYAGIPLVSALGPRIGVLAVLDTTPRRLNDSQIELLQALARQVSDLLELRRERREHQLTVERLWAAQRVAHVGSWELDIAENALIWSRQVFAIFGATREQFGATFEAFLSFVHPDDIAEFLEAQQRALRGEAPLDFTHRIVRADGAVRYVRERAQLMRRPGYQGELLVGTVQDITDEHEAEQQRRQQQRSLRDALETLSFHVNNSPLAVIEWDAEFRAIRWTAQAQAWFGWHASEVLGRLPSEWDFVHPDDVAAVDQIMADLISGVVSRNISHNRNLTSDGRILHCEWYNSARHDDHGRLISVFSLVHDVTAQVEIEQQNRELLQREQAARAEAEAAKVYYRSLFESAPGMYVVLEPESFRIVAVSEAYLAATMTKRETIIGQGIFDVFPDDPAEPDADGTRNLRASLDRVKQLGRTDVMAVQRYPIRRPAAAGGGFEERYWSPLNVPVHGPDGTLAFIIHRAEDVTDFIRQQEHDGQGDQGRQIIESRSQQLEIDIVLRSYELQRLNEQLRASESRLRMIFSGAATGIVITAASRHIIEANKAFCDMVGYPLAELQTLTISDLIHPGDTERCATLLAELIDGSRTSFITECRYHTRKGEEVWGRISGSAPRDSQGQIASLIFVCENITRQRAAEAQLASTLESMTDAFYLLDHEWRFVYVNSAAEQAVKRRREALLEQVIWDAFPETRDSELWLAYHRAVESRHAQHFEFYHQQLQNWFEVNAYPTADGLAVYFRVITEQKQQAARLAENEERFRLVAQATADTIWDWNLVNDEVWWNAGMQTIFGYEPEELEPDSRSWSSRIHPEDLIETLGSIHDVIEGSEHAWEAQYRFRRKDGNYARVLDRGFVIRSTDGEALRMVGGMTDVTDQLALEEQLHQVQRLESIGQLTGGVAHDFNNLLTVILGNAELLTEELGSEPNLRILAEMIGGAAQRGADLTRHLLAFARRQALDPRATDVNTLIAGMDPLLRRTLGEHIEIELVRAGGLWPALVDATQLESALLNLCINARDAMPNGGKLTIETANIQLDQAYADSHADVQPGQYVLLAVSDTGSGITPEHLARIFEPFFTTKEQGKGTGLGLSMVYGFIKQSRGHVNIYSEPGQGTTVRLYLPRYSGEITPAPGRGTEPHSGGHETILLVEDDELVRRFARQQLESLGYTVLTAASGREALTVFQDRNDVVLLFTDIVMPGGMSGRDLADAARILRPGLKVLFTSGYSDNAIVHHGRLDAGVQLLTKPYRRADLARKIRDILTGTSEQES